MPLEIERKFLVAGDTWRANASAGTVMRQGYLTTDPARSVRIRLAGERALLTIKGCSEGISRAEFEYEIPLAEGRALFALCLPGRISKTRYLIDHGAHRWVIDEFHDANKGLLVAEMELQDAGDSIELPEWVGAEVSDDPRYYNIALAEHPYSRWKDEP